MFMFFAIVALLLAAMGAVYWRWRRKIDEEIAEGAAIEWARLQENEPEFLAGVSEAQFREVYARVHTPRFPGYALAAFASFCAALPVVFALLAFGQWAALRLGMTPQPVDVADRLLLEDGEMRFFKATPPEAALYYVEDLAGFYFYFGVLVIWLGVFAFFMHRYHSRRPGYLRDEIIRSKSES